MVRRSMKKQRGVLDSRIMSVYWFKEHFVTQ